MTAKEAEFELFVRRVSPLLTRTAALMLQDRHAAEDLTQETLVRLHRHWTSLHDVKAADAYAYRTLVRLTRRHQRTSRFTKELLRREVEPTGSTGSDASSVEDRVRIELGRLAPRQRQTLTLRYFAQLSENETALAMQCSVGTVKSQASRGLATLRIAIGQSNSMELR